MPEHRTSFRHATLTYQDERNSAKTVHGLGFRGVCTCGEESRVYASVRMAQAWGRDHKLSKRSTTPTPPLGNAA